LWEDGQANTTNGAARPKRLTREANEPEATSEAGRSKKGSCEHMSDITTAAGRRANSEARQARRLAAIDQRPANYRIGDRRFTVWLEHEPTAAVRTIEIGALNHRRAQAHGDRVARDGEIVRGVVAGIGHGTTIDHLEAIIDNQEET
jgi:hypothetical protein